MALTSSFFACLLAVLCLLLRAGSLTGIAEQPLWLLNASIMAWPLLVFLVVYFLGHLWDSRCFWFDRICVDQQNASLKLQTIQAIPGFVAQSKKMLVLWDDTYFERTLFWICADTLVALLSASEEAGWSLYVFFGFLYAAFCLHKLQGHKRMLDQMSAFDLRNAKCTFEEDRCWVLNLFDEALEPPIRVAFDAPDAEDGTVEDASAWFPWSSWYLGPQVPYWSTIRDQMISLSLCYHRLDPLVFVAIGLRRKGQQFRALAQSGFAQGRAKKPEAKRAPTKWLLQRCTVVLPVTLAQQHGLFRAATASTVIYHLLKANCSGKDKVHSTYESLPQVYDVEFFVSHSWSCAPWMKALIISHFLNFDMALTSSFFACLLAVLCLLLRAGSLTGIAEQPLWLLNASIMAWPLLVFLVVYFLGHLWDSRCFWFDRICVDQKNASLKLQTIQAIPGFVAQSKKMLVLWDDTYFERLWCNYELAIHVKTAASLRATKIVPLWMPFWTLFWICADTVVALLSASEDAALSLYVLFGFLYAAFCFHKLQGHKHMLDQMFTFDLRNAKCTFEEDRAVIEELVLNLFDEALEPPIRVAFEAPDADAEEDAHLAG
ncbi:unnamed protein product [Cladocopium goreaui]|uniref:Uncharacterized protein n=1 Tax=Cladocopium goreaui TaxID=2562237 RepID=A0A9P1DJN2_9DINO|nr:unnamed protein product [Cladocopium goreaui]